MLAKEGATLLLSACGLDYCATHRLHTPQCSFSVCRACPSLLFCRTQSLGYHGEGQQICVLGISPCGLVVDSGLVDLTSMGYCPHPQRQAISC